MTDSLRELLMQFAKVFVLILSREEGASMADSVKLNFSHGKRLGGAGDFGRVTYTEFHNVVEISDLNATVSNLK